MFQVVQREITKDNFLDMLRDGSSHRKQFSAHSGVQKNKASPTFSVPFDNGLCLHFTSQTRRRLTWNPDHAQHYCFLRDAEAIEEAEAWEARQGTRVFLRSLMESSVALDVNFEDITSGKKTEFGNLEELAKYHQDQDAITRCTTAMAETIADIDHLDQADFICAVPALATKEFDFPRELAAGIGAMVGKADLTPHFRLQHKEKSAKDCAVEEKWDTWANSELSLDGVDVEDAKIILVDDKYQSGATMHVVAAWLKTMGAGEVHALAVVKTLRDTDNLNVIES